MGRPLSTQPGQSRNSNPTETPLAVSIGVPLWDGDKRRLVGDRYSRHLGVVACDVPLTAEGCLLLISRNGERHGRKRARTHHR